MENTNQNLKLEQVVRDATETRESVNCNYCRRQIEPGKEFRSPCGNLYCDRKCFNMYTED